MPIDRNETVQIALGNAKSSIKRKKLKFHIKNVGQLRYYFVDLSEN